MAAHRYWRIRALTVLSGFFEVAEIQLLDGTTRVDAGATKTASLAPTSGGALADIFDGSTGTRAAWTQAQAQDAGFWLAWDFGAATEVNALKQAGFDTSGRHMSAFTVQSSDDGSTWVDEGTFAGLAYPGNATFSAPYSWVGAYRYWQMRITEWSYAGAVTTSTGDVRVAELALVDFQGTEWPTVDMTGASTPAPFVASASSDDGSRPGWRAFDGNLSDGARWISAVGAGPHSLMIDLGAPVAIESIKLAPDGGGSIGYFITAFSLRASTTGAFAGEEVVVGNLSALGQSFWVSNTFTSISFNAISGTVLDDTGAGAVRTLRFYRRDTGVLLGTTTSASDGSYLFSSPYAGEIQAICLDDSGGATYNDLILRATAA